MMKLDEVRCFLFLFLFLFFSFSFFALTVLKLTNFGASQPKRFGYLTDA